MSELTGLRASTLPQLLGLIKEVGGIPLQITHKYSRLLCHSVDGAAFAVKQLLHSPEYARKLGQNGREHVRRYRVFVGAVSYIC